MSSEKRTRVAPLLMLLGLVASRSLAPNGAAAKTAAGGVQLRHEAQVMMQKERLSISREKISVQYDFVNTSNQDLTTEVAFPVPAYKLDPEDPVGEHDFGDFRVWVNGAEVKYQTEVRATVKGRDFTKFLAAMGIDAASFGEYGDENDPGPNYQVEKLSPPDRMSLIRRGLVDTDLYPLWSIAKTYYWTQKFPAHEVVHVRHEYKPVVGFRESRVGDLNARLKDACLAPATEQKLSAAVAHSLKSGARMSGDDYVNASWVKYILTTANTWQGPIRDFELSVEKPARDSRGDYFVSFCWDGPVEHPDSSHIVARKKDFSPTNELTVYFFPDY